MCKIVKEYLLKDFYGDDYMLIPYIYSYKNNGRLAILLFGEDDEPFCDMTVNIPEAVISNSNCAFVDVNNNTWLIEFILNNALGKPTGRCANSGFCEYPEYEFDPTRLNEGRPE